MSLPEEFYAPEAESKVAEPRLYLDPTEDDVGDFEDKDAMELAKMGKVQVLKRQFGFWSMLGFSVTCTITWEAVPILFVFALINGGTAGVVYEYIFTWIGYLCIIASLAELASIAPIAGGQYHWVHMLSPPRWRNLLSYVTGWHSVLSWQAGKWSRAEMETKLWTRQKLTFIATCASAFYLSGTIVQGLVVLNYPSYTPKRWHGTLLMYAILTVPTIFNVVLGKFLQQVEASILILHLALFPAILIPIVVLAPHGTTSEVFSAISKGGGYSTEGLTFLVGSVGTAFAFIGADAACHMSEESHNASRNVPIVMVTTLVINGALGFATAIAIVFCIGNVGAAVNSPTGYPFIEIFTQAVDSVNGGTAMASFILALGILATISLMAASSRMAWAFARDKGLPGSRWLSKVEPRTKLPLFAIGLTVLVTVVLAPINIGSTEAFNALVSLAVSGTLGQYVIPVILLMYKRITEPGSIKAGKFSLGWARWPINIIGVGWVFVAMFFSFWPTFFPLQSLDAMNWSCVIYGAMIIFALGFYAVYARFHYQGPIVEVNLAELRT